ncbi:MAG: phytoene desaturase family protein [Opitutales bacterium]
MTEAVVIGAGFGGMAAALRLRALGHAVTVVDRCPRPGGRAQVFERGGFRHDAGPTVLTAPFLFDELFTLFGRRREDYVEFIPLDPWYRFHFDDGATFDYGPTFERTLAEIERLSPRDVAGYRQLLAHSQRIYDIGFTELADQPFHAFSTLLRQVPHLARLGCHRTVWQLVRRHLQDERLRQAFSIHPLLVGGNPLDTTSIYSLIHYLEHRWGIHFAKGGTGALVDALARLMDEVGIKLHLGESVEQVTVRDGRATGVEIGNGRSLRADLVVSNTDPLHLYGRLLERRYQPPMLRLKTRRAKLSMGLYVLFFGTARQYPQVAHHTIWMGPRFAPLLREIFRGDALPEDFSLYLHRPTATDPSFAPAGKDAFYVLAPVPNLRSPIDWKVEGARLRDRIVAALDRSILPGLKEHIEEDFWMTPEDFRDDYHSVGGAGFSVAPLFSQSAWFRFHNRAEGVRNLYLVGAGTHPGAGLPGVLSSAKVLERVLAEEEATMRRKTSA